jgi:hypothetical protein
MRRVLLAGVPQLVAAVPAVVVLTAMGDRLPSLLASHYGPTGAADGFASHGTMLGLSIGLAALMAVVFGFIARQFGGSRSAAISRWDTGRFFMGVAWAAAAGIGVTQYGSVAANLDLADAAGATLPGWMLPVGLGAAVVGGAVGWLVAGSTPVIDHELTPVHATPLGATEQVSWSRTVGSVWIPVGGTVLVAGGIVLGVLVSWGAAAPPLIVGVLLLLFGSARVTVDRRGLTVALGVFGWPRIHVGAEDIAKVTVADVSPLQFGGWGYRIVPGGSGIVVRSGPALIVTRRSGHRFTVTVDDASTAASVLVGVAAC